MINPSGKIIARDQGKGDELVLARIDLGGEKGTGEILNRRSPELYRELLKRYVPPRPGPENVNSTTSRRGS